MAPTITFIHGMANKYASEALLRSWLNALATANGVDLDAEGVSVQMIYWADVLYSEPLTASLSQLQTESVPIGQELGPEWRARLADREALWLERLRHKWASVPTPSDPADVTERVPLPWFVKKPVMERLLRDVHHYLFNKQFSPRPGVTYHVGDEVRRRFVSALASSAGRPHIVMSHSLGTVVAYDCLKRVPGCPAIDTLFTIGSPLGLDEIQDMMLPQWSREDGYPDKVGHWINIYDGFDPVCGCDPILANDFRNAGREVVEDIHEPNEGWWRHDIEKYLRGSLLRSRLRAELGRRIDSAVESVVTSPQYASTVDEFLARIREALNQYDYEQVTDQCSELIDALRSKRTTPDPKFAAAILKELRRKRRFRDLARVADALMAAGEDAPVVQRQYVQTLIDQGEVAAGLAMAKELARRPDVGDQLSEAEGLIGRGYKQWFVEHQDAANLERSLDAYRPAWERASEDHLWHGINVVALLARAKRHGVSLKQTTDYVATAQRILAICEEKRRRKQDDAWDRATAMETCVALERYEDAITWARSYVDHSEADAFELASTLRQLGEVWELHRESPPGDLLIPLLEAELLKRQGGGLLLDPKHLHSHRASGLHCTGTLEKVFGYDSYVTWRWYRLGLERSRSVARIETFTGQPYGTGFLVAGKLFGPRWAEETLLLTNAHVVSPESRGNALAPSQAFADFETEGNLRVQVREVVASSNRADLDYSLLRLSQPVTHVEPAPLSPLALNPSQRQKLYAIGYPFGATLALSIQDNLMIDFRNPLLHYRTPTDPGSSGSPIFDEQWQLVALHHAGGRQMPKLSGTGTYEANEGIWIQAIQEHVGGAPTLANSRSIISGSIAPHATSSRQSTHTELQSLSRPGTAMSNHQKESLLRSYAQSIASRDRLEEARAELPTFAASALESVPAASPEPSIDAANRAIDKLRTGQPLDVQEMFSVEAIVLPKERPVVFVRNNTYPTPESPWTHFSGPRIKANIEKAILSIGRVELPSNLNIPYGGTAFVVGPNLLMTNRHVAELFAQGLGTSVTFLSGQDAAWDYLREYQIAEDNTTTLTIHKIVMIHPYWDMALLHVSGLKATQEPLRLATVDPQEINDKDVAVIGYPAKDLRNDIELQDRIFKRVYNVKRLQPGKLKTRATIGSFGKSVHAITHDSSTLGGNSGSAVVLAETGDVVALHFAGLYLKANYAVPVYELARDPRVVAAGVNFVGSRAPEDPIVAAAWRQLDEATTPGIRRVAGPPAATGSVTVAIGETTFSVPIRVSATIRDYPEQPGIVSPTDITEAMKTPRIAPRLDKRDGYDPDFLNLDGDNRVPLPALTEYGKNLVARLDDGSHELKYHKFTICLHKIRRMALFTAANVDWRDDMRRVNGRIPSRQELNGFTSDASERWVTDERIAQMHQLPDRFYTKDGGEFDKGHLVRRNDVTWGTSFADIQKANGDTFHMTNCSPQTSAFNRSASGEDNWGDLENLVQRETAGERAIVLSGPVLAEDDLRFEGMDERGDVHIQIPSRFWKIIVVKDHGAPEVFAFVQEQDLSDVPLEFAVPQRWLRQMQSIENIEKLLFGAAQLDWYKQFDQFEKETGRRVRRRLRR
ncbi:MAG: TRAFs-binding domain-containing protein [Pirellulaceae bacterium]